MRRDSAWDGRFVYAMATTGVYCRPSCAARPALRKNVAFHASRRDAEHAGFRPCLRCKPDQPPLAARQAAIAARACALIDAAAQAGDDAPDLDALAAAVGVSRFHFHRIFKAATGITPRRMPTPAARGGCRMDWRSRRRSPTPCTRPVSIPAAAFMRKRRRCWA